MSSWRAGTTRSTTVDPSTVERWVAKAIAEEGVSYVAEVVQRVQKLHGKIPQLTLLETVQHRVFPRRR